MSFIQNIIFIGNWSKKEASEREVEQCKKFHVTVLR